MLKKEKIFLSSFLLNSLGNNFYSIALPLLVYKMSQSAGAMGMMGVIEAVPILLLGVFIGAIVDRSNLKVLLGISVFVQAILMFLVAMVSRFQLDMLMLYVLGGSIAINVEVFKVSMFASIPKIFEDLEKGNAKVSSITSLSELIAPFIVSMIVAQFQIEMVFVVNFLTSVLFLFVLLATLDFRCDERENERLRTNLFQEIGAGVRAIQKVPAMKYLICLVALSNLADAGLIPLFVYRMSKDFHLHEVLVSTLIGMSGFGAFLGSFSPYFLKKSTLGKRLFWGLLINNGGIFILLLPHWEMMPLSLFICNFGGMIYYISKTTMIQLFVAQEMLGRVNSVFILLTQFMRPLSISLLMFLTSQLGSYPALLFSIVITGITTILLFTSKLKDISH